MNRVGVNQVVGFNRHILGLQAVDDVQQQSLTGLESMFGATASIFTLRPEGSPIPTFDRYCIHGVPDGFTKVFSFDALRLDPFVRVFVDRPGFDLQREVRFGSELVPYDKLVRTSFYWQYMEPYGLHHMLRMELVAGSRSLATIGLFRPKQERNFCQADDSRAMLIVSALAAALDRALQREVYQDNWSLLESSASSHSGTGLIVLDERLRVIYYDANAREHCTMLDDDPATRGGTALPVPLREPIARFRERLGRETATAHSVDVDVLGSGQSDNAIKACVTGQRTHHGRWRILIFLRQQRRPVDPRQRLIETRLTRREYELVQHVMTGLKNREIAKHMAISINTVQCHLRAIFEKLQVRNRAELIVKMTVPAPFDNA